MAKYADGNGLSHAFTVIKNWVTTNFSAITHTHAASEITNAVTGVKGNSETDYRTGNVNLTAANLGAATSSHTHGNITNGGDITASAPTVASGDKLIINDESASKITNGPSFGADTTKYLRNDGTWAAPVGTSYPTYSAATAESGPFVHSKPASNKDYVTYTANSWKTIMDALLAAHNEYTENGSITDGSALVWYNDGTSGNITFEELPDSDTKNTAGSSADASKLYLVGAKSQSSSGVQTYSQANAYITAGKVYSDGKECVNLSGSQALTNKTYNGYTLGAACAKAVDSSIASGSTSTNLPTSAAVASAISTALSDVAGALVYQGAAASASAISGTSYKKGWYWIASAAFTLYTGVTVEAGDMIIAKQDKTSTFANDVDVVQSNIEALTTAEIDALWTAA